jgi:DNA-binding response OmpR family regulator
MTSPLILLIDDDRSWCDTASAVLEAEGYEVRTALDGQQGLDLLAESAPLLVILDMHMPRRTGIEVLREMRRGRPQPPPVLMLSAAAGADEIGRAITEGAAAFLTKPLTAQSLRQTVRRLLRASVRQVLQSLVAQPHTAYYLTCVQPVTLRLLSYRPLASSDRPGQSP